MTRRALFVWGLSVLLLAWIMGMAALSSLNAGCARDGQHFSVHGWACVPLGPAIILQRDLQRG